MTFSRNFVLCSAWLAAIIAVYLMVFDLISLLGGVLSITFFLLAIGFAAAEGRQSANGGSRQGGVRAGRTEIAPVDSGDIPIQ